MGLTCNSMNCESLSPADTWARQEERRRAKRTCTHSVYISITWPIPIANFTPKATQHYPDCWDWRPDVDAHKQMFTRKRRSVWPAMLRRQTATVEKQHTRCIKLLWHSTEHSIMHFMVMHCIHMHVLCVISFIVSLVFLYIPLIFALGLQQLIHNEINQNINIFHYQLARYVYWGTGNLSQWHHFTVKMHFYRKSIVE